MSEEVLSTPMFPEENSIVSAEIDVVPGEDYETKALAIAITITKWRGDTQRDVQKLMRETCEDLGIEMTKELTREADYLSSSHGPKTVGISLRQINEDGIVPVPLGEINRFALELCNQTGLEAEKIRIPKNINRPELDEAYKELLSRSENVGRVLVLNIPSDLDKPS